MVTKTRMLGTGTLLAALVFLGHGMAQAEVTIEAVHIGHPGNADDTHGDGYGGVDYEYNIGKYEVTAGQYTEFLNAVAATDTYSLYNTDMWTTDYGCKIQRTDTESGYAYNVASDWAERPVNYVSWGDAARFANWLHNGQPTGMQDLTTTEDGAYYLNGAATDAELMAVNREPGWTWAITSEDEWYKAAYHKNDGDTGNYFDYPTSSDTAPGYVNNSGNLSGTGGPFVEGGADPGNYATVDGDAGTDGVGDPYYRTEIGEWESSESPYGTFDQGGNVFEWNEAVLEGASHRGARGGCFYSYAGYTGMHFLQSSNRAAHAAPASDERHSWGFRVSQVPEPGTTALLALGAVGMLMRRRRVRR